jgi:uncharacterized membrane protein
MILGDLFTFTGRLHPMVVHLPIGFLLLGIAFDLLSYARRYRSLKKAVPFTLFAGFASAVVACIAGYMLSISGEYDLGILYDHKIAGIVLAITAGIGWLMATSFKRFIGSRPYPVTALYFIILMLLIYTGHKGSNLTHGSDYLSWQTLIYEKREKPAKAEEAFLFEDVVLPMLERRCAGCHGKGKRKGNLIVTSYDALMKGGKHGKVIVTGKSAESELYKRITLDPSHDEFMPTDGKPPLSKTETEVIRWWIDKAHAATEKKITDVEGNEKMLSSIAALLELPGALPLSETVSETVRTVNPLIPPIIDMNVVEHLRRKGLMIRVMLHTPVMLDATLPPASGIAMNEIEKDLAVLAKNIIWLNLSDNHLTEADLSILKQMSNLEKLRLEKNPIGDGIVDLVSVLKNLESLNVNETHLTDAGLSKLSKFPSLKRIYTWKTFVKTAK